MKDKVVTIRVDEELLNKLKKLADEEKRSLSNLICMLLEEAVN